jgi:poly(3-hydroxybutyrate) depolymerase
MGGGLKRMTDSLVQVVDWHPQYAESGPAATIHEECTRLVAQVLLADRRWLGDTQSSSYHPGETPMRSLAIGLMLFCTPAFLRAEEPPREIVLVEGVGIRSVGRSGRAPVHVDAIEHQIVTGAWKAPRAGDMFTLPDESQRTWEPVKADKEGWFRGPALRGGYAFFSVPSASERVMILEATGHAMVYVNGEPRAGDPYSTGYIKLPVLLKEGGNEFLFLGGRGQLHAKLTTPRDSCCFDASDVTLPDLVKGETGELWAALPVINASLRPTTVDILVRAPEDAGILETRSIALAPLSTRKVGFRLPVDHNMVKAEGNTSVELHLRGGNASNTVLDTYTLKLAVRRPDQIMRRTFLSQIDGSVQYYALNPASPSSFPQRKPALFLTLHGASVEAAGQAAAYAPKTWGHLVAPTNRRPYGFDWEDWGRLDALEVLEHAQRTLGTDPQRVYLTGHSMGGHGAWHLGVTYPDKWAAVGPSAGWISMFSYAGARKEVKPTPIQELLQRCTNPSDTLALLKNLAPLGVYVLHGDKDNDVPVTQARTMKEELGKFHQDFHYFEQPGAIHWWGGNQEGCVDWPPMFDLFGRRVIPTNDSVRRVDFVTTNPGVSAWSHWVGIEAQSKQLLPSTVHLRYDPGVRRFAGTTENVARLALDLRHIPLGGDLQVELDDQKLSVKSRDWERLRDPARIWFARQADKWSQMERPDPREKNAQRYGLFKDAFRNRFKLVYGTHGTPEENAWALAKARFDAERWWYQGNGSAEVLSDAQYMARRKQGGSAAQGNVILYGNADTHEAWNALLDSCPVRIHKGSVRVGQQELHGQDLGCLFLYPASGGGAIGVVGGSGLAGMKLTDRLPYWSSGVAYPDVTILDATVLTRGYPGVRCAGFFGLDWKVESGEFVWQK